jgi:hypothetical protein
MLFRGVKLEKCKKGVKVRNPRVPICVARALGAALPAGPTKKKVVNAQMSSLGCVRPPRGEVEAPHILNIAISRSKRDGGRGKSLTL